MSTATKPEEIRSPGFGYEPDALPFGPWTGHALLYAVVDAIQEQRELLETGVRADDFVVCLKRGAERLDRVSREAGEDVREEALRAALAELEQAYGILGHPDNVGDLVKSAGAELNSTLGDHFYAAAELLEWALAGCRARLAELEED